MASDISEQARLAVARRSNHRCEYCLIHEDDAGFRHQVDHIISRKHGGSSVLENLAYACVPCNRFKGTDVASIDSTGEPVALFNPRRHQWSAHFRFDGPIIVGLTSIGEVTIRVLRMNAAERMLERRLLRDDITPP